MKLYVISKKDGSKLYLNISANSKYEFVAKFGRYFRLNDGNVYLVEDVFAEAETNSTTTGMIIGGIVGFLAGPIGIVVGAGLGGALGNRDDENEKEKVRNFNRKI